MHQESQLNLETQRLSLRPPLLADASNIQTQITNWEVAKWLGRLPWPYPNNGAEEWINRILKGISTGTGYAFAIIANDFPEKGVIGVVGLQGHEDGTWVLGYWLGEPYWDRGYMSEATAEVVRWALETLNLDRIESGHIRGNEGSARVLARCGFKYVGEEHRHSEPLGHEVDVLTMRLTHSG